MSFAPQQARQFGTNPHLAASTAPADRLAAQLAEAEAVLGEAKLRQQQAASGQGGRGARPEDIAALQAKLAGDKVALRLRQPFDDVRFLQGPILLYRAWFSRPSPCAMPATTFVSRPSSSSMARSWSASSTRT